jgi:hypothetical protein
VSAKADLKHTAALVAVGTGGAALICAAVTGYVAVTTGPTGFLGCTAVAGLVGLCQVRRGLRLRNKAVAEGATLFDGDLGLGPVGDVRTSHTEAKKPSFLDREKKPEG